jgi:hypothetical protein
MNTMLRRLTPTIMCLSLLTGLYLVPALRAGPVAQPIAVPIFECIGLCWKAPGGTADEVCQASYRPAGSANWKEALPLWFDGRNRECRGSIVRWHTRINRRPSILISRSTRPR